MNESGIKLSCQQHWAPGVVMVTIVSSLVRRELSLWQPTVPLMTTKFASGEIMVISEHVSYSYSYIFCMMYLLIHDLTSRAVKPNHNWN